MRAWEPESQPRFLFSQFFFIPPIIFLPRVGSLCNPESEALRCNCAARSSWKVGIGSRSTLSIALSAGPGLRTTPRVWTGTTSSYNTMGDPAQIHGPNWPLLGPSGSSHSKPSGAVDRPTLYTGVSNRSRGWKSRRRGESNEGSMPHSLNIKRWDGAKRACVRWDSLKRVRFFSLPAFSPVANNAVVRI